MKFTKKVKTTFFKNFFKLLPANWQRRIIFKKYVRKDLSPLKDLTVKIATSEQEALDALNVLYESYEHKKLTNKNDFKTHVTKFHILPTTAIIVAYLEGKPVGTCTLFMDSELGLPLESHWNIDEMRFDCKFALELGSLAILPKHQKASGKILFPMVAFSFRYADQKNINGVFITVHPDIAEFYRHIYGFNFIDNKIVEYKGANKAKAVGLYANMQEMKKHLKTKLPGQKESLYHYFFEKKFYDTLIYDLCDYDDGIPFIHSNDNFETLFNKVIQINQVLSTQEKITLSSIVAEEQKKYFKIPDVEFIYRRNEFRYHCNMKGILLAESMTQYPVEIYNVSKAGFGAYVLTQKPDLDEGQMIELIVYLNPVKPLKVKASVKFISDRKIGGQLLYIQNTEWEKFIEFMYLKYKTQIDQFGLNHKKAS